MATSQGVELVDWAKREGVETLYDGGNSVDQGGVALVAI